MRDSYLEPNYGIEDCQKQARRVDHEHNRIRFVHYITEQIRAWW